jgi:hypothetical protein
LDTTILVAIISGAFLVVGAVLGTIATFVTQTRQFQKQRDWERERLDKQHQWDVENQEKQRNWELDNQRREWKRNRLLTTLEQYRLELQYATEHVSTEQTAESVEDWVFKRKLEILRCI